MPFVFHHFISYQNCIQNLPPLNKSFLGNVNDFMKDSLDTHDKTLTMILYKLVTELIGLKSEILIMKLWGLKKMNKYMNINALVQDCEVIFHEIGG